MKSFSPTLVEVVDLSHSYGEREGLKGLNLGMGKGEVFALIGPTGAGKTTLLRIVDLLEVPGAGGNLFWRQMHPPVGETKIGDTSSDVIYTPETSGI